MKQQTSKAFKLRKTQILNVCQSLLSDYINYLDQKEKEIIQNIINHIDDFSTLDNITNELLPIIEKIWNIKLNSGEYIIISWYKHTDKIPQNLVTYATISKRDDIIQFCDLRYGMEYKICFKSILGALNVDGGTVVEKTDKDNDYTVGRIDGFAINSYNGATKLITPKQLLKRTHNTYQSKHNELILDNRYISAVGPYTLEDEKLLLYEYKSIIKKS